MLVQTQTGFDSLGTRRLNHELRILSKESYSQSGDKLETEADGEILNKLSWRESGVCRQSKWGSLAQPMTYVFAAI